MQSILVKLLSALQQPSAKKAGIIGWGSPVPSFGDVYTAEVATLGLNPSNLEFMSQSGRELKGCVRRFHTLASFGIESWDEVDSRHLRFIVDSCRNYFSRNPYNRWFKRLDDILSGANISYYKSLLLGQNASACHLDLIPFATKEKWTDLSASQKTILLKLSSDSLGLLVRDSLVNIIILNGATVAQTFEMMADVNLAQQQFDEWSLPRSASRDVVGYAYRGKVRQISGIWLDKEVTVLGYNHNIQSSYGVTKHVMESIRHWIGTEIEKVRANEA